jgi:hypothetical protein
VALAQRGQTQSDQNHDVKNLIRMGGLGTQRIVESRQLLLLPVFGLIVSVPPSMRIIRFR